MGRLAKEDDSRITQLFYEIGESSGIIQLTCNRSYFIDRRFDVQFCRSWRSFSSCSHDAHSDALTGSTETHGLEDQQSRLLLNRNLM